MFKTDYYGYYDPNIFREDLNFDPNKTFYDPKKIHFDPNKIKNDQNMNFE